MPPAAGTRDELLRQIEVIRAKLEVLDASDDSFSEPHAEPSRIAPPIQPHPMAVIEWDSTRCVRRWSAHAEDLFGFRAEEVIGRSWKELSLVHEADLNRVQPINADLISGRVDFDTSVNRNVRKGGEVIQCEWFNSILRDEHGRVASMLSLVRDVSDVRPSARPAGTSDAATERIGGAMEALVLTTARKQGAAFFNALVESLARVLDVRCAVVSKVKSQAADIATSVAVWMGDGLKQGSSFPLQGTPCGKILEQRMSIYPERIQELFPNDRSLAEMDAQCYAGTQIIASNGETIGLLAVVDDKPCAFGDETAAILEVYADQAAEELERTQIEEELRASESMYRQLFEMSPSANFVISDDRIVFANRAALEMIDAERFGKISERRFSSFFDADGRRKLAACVEASGAGSAGTPIELRLLREGREIPIEFRAASVEFGGKSATLAMVVDASERKQIESALHLTQHSVDQSVVGIIWVNPEGRTIYVNDAACEQFGYSRDEMLQMHSWDLSPGHSPEKESIVWERLRAEGQLALEVECVTKDGRCVPMRLTGSYAQFNGQEFAFVYTADLTEEKRAERALQQSHEQYRNLIENMSDVVYRYEYVPEPRFTFVSQSVTELTGYTPEDHYADPMLGFKLVHPDDVHLLEEAVKLTITDGNPVTVRWIRKDGGMVWTEPRNTPFFDENGQLVAIEGIARNVTLRHKAEVARRESEHRLHELQLIAGVGDFTWEPDTGAVTWSAALFELLGYEPDMELDFEFVRTSVFHPEDLPAIEAWLKECLDSEANALAPKEFRLVRKSGDEIHIRTVGFIERAEDRSAKWIGTLQDITRRKRAELELRQANAELERHRERLEELVAQRTAQLSAAIAKTEESEARLSAILENTSMLIGLCSPDGTVLRANRAVRETVGATEAEFVGKPLWHTPDWPAEVQEQVKRAVSLAAAGDLPRHELHQLRPDGSLGILDFSISPIRDEDGEIVFLIPEGRDVTQQRAIERRLRFTQTTVDHASDAVFWINEDTRFVYVNDAACKGLGYRREELLEMRVVDIDPLARANFWPNFAPRLAEVGSVAIETIHKRKDGSTFPVDISMIRMDHEGETYVVAFARDMTDRKRHQLELEVAKDRAEAADRLKSAFLANMSHELRTPLSSIIGFADVLLEKIPGELNPEQAKQLGIIEQNAQHLLTLINDILDISKIESGQFTVAREPFDVGESIARVTEMVRPIVDQAGLRLNVDGDCGGSALGDGLRFQQILINLLNNAIRFTPEGVITIGCRDEEERVLVSVRDTGVGIAKSDQGRLFVPFQQLDSGLDRKHDGSGLGLAISARLAQLMGGDIDVESVVGEGSSFTVALPRCQRLSEMKQLSDH